MVFYKRLRKILTILIVFVAFNSSAQYYYCDYENYCDDKKMEILKNYKNYELTQGSYMVEKYYDKNGNAVCFKRSEDTAVYSGSVLINDTLFKVYGSYLKESDLFFGVMTFDDLCYGIINWNYSEFSKCDYCIRLSRVYKNKIYEYDLCENTPHAKMNNSSKYFVKNYFDSLMFEKEVKIDKSIALPRVLKKNEFDFIPADDLLKINNLIANAPSVNDSLIFWYEFTEYENNINVSLRYKTNRGKDFLYGVLEVGEEKYKIAGFVNWAFLWKDSLIVGYVKWNPKDSYTDKLTEDERFEIGYSDIHVLELYLKGKKNRINIRPSRVYCYNGYGEEIGSQREKREKIFFGDYDYRVLYENNRIEFSYLYNENKGEFGKGRLKLLDSEKFTFDVVNIGWGDGLYFAEVWCGETFKGELRWEESEVDSSMSLDYTYCEEPSVKECINEYYELVRKEDKKIVYNGKDISENEGGSDYDNIDEEALFPNGYRGYSNLNMFISNNIRFPEKAIDDSISGKVIVRFEIGIDGKVENVEIIKRLHPECDKEVLRVIRSMPNWKPAKNNGKPVKSTLTMPVSFDQI